MISARACHPKCLVKRIGGSVAFRHRQGDVAGTAMLTFSHGLEPDDQWLYLPSIKRVKRISSKNKSGPFMVWIPG